MLWGAKFDKVLSVGGCFLVKLQHAQRSSVGLYIKLLGSVELFRCDHGLSKRLPCGPTWQQETQARAEPEAEDKTHQGLFKTPSSELRIMKALQLSVIKAEELDKNSMLVSWEFSPFSKHYPSESSLDGFAAYILQDSSRPHPRCHF